MLTEKQKAERIIASLKNTFEFIELRNATYRRLGDPIPDSWQQEQDDAEAVLSYARQRLAADL